VQLTAKSALADLLHGGLDGKLAHGFPLSATSPGTGPQEQTLRILSM
jgi:hypothetical protein